MQRQQILDRIHDCETVLRDINNSSIWKILVKDLEQTKELVDSKWQTVKMGDTANFEELRILKLSAVHILNLPNLYKQDLEAAQKALNAIDKVDTEIAKDYDLETNIEDKEPEGGDYGSR